MKTSFLASLFLFLPITMLAQADNSNTALLNMQVDLLIDNTSLSDFSSGHTRVYVRYVTFEGFSTEGTSSLNSEWTHGNTAYDWFDISSTSITIYDGRKDDREGMEAAMNEWPLGLNSLLVQSTPYVTTLEDNQYTSFSSAPGEPGVTGTAVNLFNSDSVGASVYVIPSQKQFKVTVCYGIESADYHLNSYLSDGKTRGASVENTITKSVTLPDGEPLVLESGNRYTVKLHLGLNSAKVDTEVAHVSNGVEAVNSSAKKDFSGKYYTIDGTLLQGAPSKKGVVYISKGKKMLVK